MNKHAYRHHFSCITLAISAAFLFACGGDDAAGGTGQVFIPRDAGGAGGSAGTGGAGGPVVDMGPTGGQGGAAGMAGQGGSGGTAGSGGMAGAGGQGGSAGAGGEPGEFVEVPQTGEVIISEIMLDPHNGLTDENAEWIELYNTSDQPFALEDCQLTDGTSVSELGDVTIEPGGYALYGRSDDQGLNGGLDVDGIFDFALNNSRDRIVLQCGGSIVDVMHYDFDEGFPRAQGFSLSLTPGQESTVANDQARNWCVARRAYLEAPVQWGTPGAANGPCDEITDFCRLQSPTAIPNDMADGRYREEVTIYGRVREQGITDRSASVDAYGLVRGYLGFGPDGSQPQNNDEWVWIWARPNAEYDANASGEPDADEYQARLFIPLPGQYDYAYRFTVDGGRSWLYCDGGQAGSDDGYTAENAGQLTAAPPLAPCDPNPCGRPPVGACEGDTAVQYGIAGECMVGANGLAECAYPATRRDCGETAQVCIYGACYDQRPQGPGRGEIVFSEIMYNPDDPDYEPDLPRAEIRENNAEWIEVYNPTDRALNLDDCQLTDFDENRAQQSDPTVIEGVIVEPGDVALFVRSDIPDFNGGLRADHRFYFNLTNSSDTLILTCGGLVIDQVTYTDGAGNRNAARATSISLDARAFNAMDNDLDQAWCLSSQQYLADPVHRGTPGVVNPICERCVEVTCDQPPARSCDENTRVSYAPIGQCRVDGIDEICDYQETRQECGVGEACQQGFCGPEGARTPFAGEVIVNEIMYDPGAGLADSRAEWFELTSVADTPISLSGCVVRDQGAESAIEGVFLSPGEFALFGRSADVNENGNIVPDALFGFSLNNAGDEISLVCGQTTIDLVIYGRDNSFPAHSQGSIQLDVDNQDARSNDSGLFWCASDQIYLAEPQHFGTPGRANTACGGQ
ncbi:MAG: hypothetical protein CMH52_08950 [Myxococcales bacterium]|nr:hypothetical protein [Myxococcales bacterium]